MKILFAGTSDFSVPFLEALHAHYNIKAVLTLPDRQRGRRRRPRPTPVKEKAVTLGLDVWQPEKLDALHETIKAHDIDLLITVAYGKKVPSPMLEAPRKAPVNVHASLLPALRGAAPITRAVEYGYETTGVSIMHMVDRMDAGPVYASSEVSLACDETKGTLSEKLIRAGIALLVETLPRIASGEIEPEPQTEGEATYAPKVGKEEARLSFDMAATKIHRKIRAFNPSPGAFTTLDGRKLKVFSASPLETRSDATPGTVVHVDKHHAVVKAKVGALSLKRVQLESKKAMDITSFLNGAGRTLLKEGIRLE